MNKLFATVLVALLGAGVSSDTFLPRANSSDQDVSMKSNLVPIPQASPFYLPVVAGLAERKDGTTFSFQSFRSADGREFNLEIERRETIKLAQIEVQKQVGASSRVIEDGPFVEADEKVAGRRIVLERKSAVGNSKIFVVVKNSNKTIRFLESRSLEAVLDFEAFSDFPDY